MSEKKCDHKNCNCKNKEPDLSDLILTKPQLEEKMQVFEETKEDLKQSVKALEVDNPYREMVHLHNHYFTSILDGCNDIDECIKLAKKFNHKSLTILDHGNLAGTFSFYQKCKKAGIKPILGMEAYVNDNMGSFEEKKFEGGNSHQSILIKDHSGFINLNRLAYMSFTEGFYRRGRIKTEWLIEHKKGLIITTSCMASHMSKLVQDGKANEAEEYLKMLKREFGDDLYAELQFNEIPHQKEYNKFIVLMAKKYDIPPILTGDVHYAYPEDNRLQDVLIAINQKKKLGEAFALDARHLYYTNDRDFHEFNVKFGYNYPAKFVDRCLENTLRVAEKCNFDFDTTTAKYPVYEPTNDVISYFKSSNTEEIIRKLSHGKLKQKMKLYQENGVKEINDVVLKEYSDRLNYELEVISKKGMLDYFLVFWEFIRDYRSKGWETGPGRGCFISGSRVKMADGMYAPIDTIKTGDEVLDAFGDKRKVLDTLEYDIEEDIIELEMEDGRKISCTLDHEILTNNRGWVMAKDLTEEDDIKDILLENKCGLCGNLVGNNPDCIQFGVYEEYADEA